MRFILTSLILALCSCGSLATSVPSTAQRAIASVTYAPEVSVVQTCSNTAGNECIFASIPIIGDVLLDTMAVPVAPYHPVAEIANANNTIGFFTIEGQSPNLTAATWVFGYPAAYTLVKTIEMIGASAASGGVELSNANLPTIQVATGSMTNGTEFQTGFLTPVTGSFTACVVQTVKNAGYSEMRIDGADVTPYGAGAHSGYQIYELNNPGFESCVVDFKTSQTATATFFSIPPQTP